MLTMKYAVNHQEKFLNYKAVFVFSLLRTITIMLVEIVNFVLIVGSINVENVVLNFVALEIIADFDDIFYESLKSDIIKQFMEDEEEYNRRFLLIERTTSRRASDETLLLKDGTR